MGNGYSGSCHSAMNFCSDDKEFKIGEFEKNNMLSPSGNNELSNNGYGEPN